MRPSYYSPKAIMHSNLLSTIPYAEWSSTYCVTVHIDGDTHPPKLLTSVILSEAKDLVLIGHGHAPCHSSLKSRQSGLLDSIKATFFARTQPFMCFSRARAAFTSDVSSK